MNKYLSRMMKHKGAVVEYENLHDHVLTTGAPSCNFTFGNGWGLPLGCGILLYGPPSAGKSLLINSMIGQLHKNDDDAIAIKFDTEGRETLQNSLDAQAAWGIDRERYMCFSTNDPAEIFDYINKDIAAMIDDGAKIKLIAIDSLTDIIGVKTQKAASIANQQIGDNARTVQDGINGIRFLTKRKKIGLVMTSQVRSEMDPHKARFRKWRVASSWAVGHAAEYKMMIDRDNSADGRVSLDGQEFIDDSVRDLRGQHDVTGHKIKVMMEDSKGGPKRRVGVFTVDYKKGIINQHEEVFLLGVNRGVIETPNQKTYVFGGKQWVAKKNMLGAIRENQDLYRAILEEVKRRDMAGEGPVAPVVASEFPVEEEFEDSAEGSSAE